MHQVLSGISELQFDVTDRCARSMTNIQPMMNFFSRATSTTSPVIVALYNQYLQVIVQITHFP
jgi:hypothetical protein